MSATVGRRSDMTVDEVAEQMSCSPSTVYALIRSGALDHYRLSDGGHIRITEDALNAYRDAGASRDPWERTRPIGRAS